MLLRLSGRLVCVAMATAVAASGCVTTLPAPTPPPATPPPTAATTPVPAPTARSYVVQRGDTLGRIATRFDLTVGQLLTANPAITDPDVLQVGQVLVIPPPGAPDTSPTSEGLSDARDDLVDLSEEPITGEGYADVTRLALRADRGALRIELGLVSRPPARVDAAFEVLVYAVVVDVDDDGQPDYRIKYANDADDAAALDLSLEDRGSGQIRSGDDFPGELTVRQGGLTWTIDPDALGGGERWRIAARVERSFYPGGRADPEVESTVDLVPNQSWPRTNPRWVELGAPLASPAE